MPKRRYVRKWSRAVRQLARSGPDGRQWSGSCANRGRLWLAGVESGQSGIKLTMLVSCRCSARLKADPIRISACTNRTPWLHEHQISPRGL